jgi:hypothetical protein
VGSPQLAASLHWFAFFHRIRSFAEFTKVLSKPIDWLFAIRKAHSRIIAAVSFRRLSVTESVALPPRQGSVDAVSRTMHNSPSRKARGPSPSRPEGRNDSDRQRLHQLHGSQYVDCWRNARRNKLSWDPRALHPDPGAGRTPHGLPRHMAATNTDRRHVRVRPPQLAERSWAAGFLCTAYRAVPRGGRYSGT